MFKKISFFTLVIFIFGCKQSTQPLALPSGDIAYMSNRDSDTGKRNNTEIFIMNKDGSNKRNLTNHPADDSWPKFSPDGLKIAFISYRNEIEDLYLMDISGENLICLTKNLWVKDFQFSPDGTKMLLETKIDGNNEILIRDIDGKNLTNLTNDPSTDFRGMFTNDGSNIIFSSDRDSPSSGMLWQKSNVYKISLSGDILNRLTENDSSNYVTSISPDNQYILYVSNITGDEDLYKMNIDGSNKQNLTQNPACDVDGTFSPDGSKIMFRSTRKNGGPDICIMDSDGKNQKILVDSEVAEWGQQFSPDGSKIVFASYLSGDAADIYIMDIDGQNIKRLTNDEYLNSAPVFRPFSF